MPWERRERGTRAGSLPHSDRQRRRCRARNDPAEGPGDAIAGAGAAVLRCAQRAGTGYCCLDDRANRRHPHSDRRVHRWRGLPRLDWRCTSVRCPTSSTRYAGSPPRRGRRWRSSYTLSAPSTDRWRCPAAIWLPPGRIDISAVDFWQFDDGLIVDSSSKIAARINPGRSGEVVRDKLIAC